MNNENLPVSYLFVPADQPKYIDKAVSKGADVVILDLEDSVPAANKPAARELLKSQLSKLSDKGQTVAVRVNAELINLYEDILAIDLSKVSYILLPKAEEGAVVQWICEFIETLEQHQGCQLGKVKLIPMVESCLGLNNLRQISKASERVCAIALGSEDFANELGVQPTRESLQGICQQMILATTEAKIAALGFPGSIANINDIAKLNSDLTLAKSMGFAGALCIHPKQVDEANKVFSYSEEQLIWASQVLEAMEKAEQEGLGVIKLNGKMIDAPVVSLARKILNRTNNAN